MIGYCHPGAGRDPVMIDNKQMTICYWQSQVQIANCKSSIANHANPSTLSYLAYLVSKRQEEEYQS